MSSYILQKRRTPGSEKRMETFRNAAPQIWAYFEALEKNNWRS